MAGEFRIQNIKKPYSTFLKGTQPDTPDAGTIRLWVDEADDHLKYVDEDDVVVDLEEDAGEEVASGYEFDYVERTTPLSVTATSEGTAQTVIAGNSVSYDGSTKICIEFFTPRARADLAGAARFLVLVLLEDSTVLGNLALLRTPAANTDDKEVFARRFITPSSGAHTYTVKAWVSAGTGSLDPEAGGSGSALPAYLRITKA